MWTLKYIVNSNLAIVNNLFDSVRLGLSSSTNILQIPADVALQVVFLLFLLCF